MTSEAGDLSRFWPWAVILLVAIAAALSTGTEVTGVTGEVVHTKNLRPMGEIRAVALGTTAWGIILYELPVLAQKLGEIQND